MKIPAALKIAVLAVAATAFYTYVGQLVPQKQVLPPEVIEIDTNLTPEELAAVGQGIFQGKGLCSTCHTLGKTGALRFPDLAGIGSRAATRIPGVSGLRYMTQSLYQPNAYIVDGFNPGMPTMNKPPMSLTDQEILAVVAYLQTLGGTLTLTPESKLPIPGSEIEEEVAFEQVPAAGGTGGVLDRLACNSCHHLDQPGVLKASSLFQIGQRKNRNQILADILSSHSEESFMKQATIDDLRQIVDILSAQGGN